MTPGLTILLLVTGLLHAAEVETRIVRFDMAALERLSVEAREHVARHVDECAIDDGKAVLFLSPEEIQELRSGGVTIEDEGSVADYFKKFAPSNTLKKKRIPSLGLEDDDARAGGAGVASCEDLGVSLYPYNEYHSLAEGICLLRNLADAFPEITQLLSIGQSVEGRDIWALKITDNPEIDEPNEERILFTGVTHAREWATHELVLYLAEKLTSLYRVDAEIKHIIDHSVVWLVPVVNPDGFEYSWTTKRLWRTNKNGVDINRNYSYRWGRDGVGSSQHAGVGTYRGPSPASEPETRAIQNLLAEQRFAVAVSYHSYSQMALYPWGYTALVAPESYTSLRSIAKRYTDIVFSVSGNRYFHNQWSYGLYLGNGVFSDYAYGMHGTLPLTVEVRPRLTSEGGFLLPEHQIPLNNRENMAAARWLMINVASATDVDLPDDLTLLDASTNGKARRFSLPLTPINQKPQYALGLGTNIHGQLRTWLDDAEHQPAYEGRLLTDFEGCGAGSAYSFNANAATLDWITTRDSFKVLPRVFEDGSQVMLSNVDPGINIIGVPSLEPVLLEDVGIIKRRITPTGSRWGHGELILGRRTAIEDMSAAAPWIDWTWRYAEATGEMRQAHPTGAGGASRFVEPFRAYEINVNVPSWNFGDTVEAVYLLQFPGSSVQEFRRGDANGDGFIDVSDPIRTLLDLFVHDRDVPCPDAADVDDSGTLGVPDALRMVQYLFLQGSPLPAPGSHRCGPDPTDDGLVCDLYGGCGQ